MMILGEHAFALDLGRLQLSHTMLVRGCFHLSGLVLTIPFGWLADKCGRQLLLVEGFLGQVLAYLRILLVLYLVRTSKVGDSYWYRLLP